MASNDATLLPIPDHGAPDVHDTAYLAPGSRLVGDVTIAEGASVWFNAVLRADADRIVLGAGSNVQDGVAVHCDAGFPAIIGRDVSIGHNAVVHGCTVEDGALIGMGAVILNGAVIGAGSLVAGGAVVLEGTVVPPRSLVAGVPAKVRRELSDEEVASLTENGRRYVENAARFRALGSNGRANT